MKRWFPVLVCLHVSCACTADVAVVADHVVPAGEAASDASLRISSSDTVGPVTATDTGLAQRQPAEDAGTDAVEVAAAEADVALDGVAPDMADAAAPADSAADLPAVPTGCAPLYVSPAPTAGCPYFLEEWSCPGGAYFAAMAVLADGGITIAGGLGAHAWFVRTDAAGQVLAQEVSATLDPAVALTRTMDDHLVIAGAGPYHDVPEPLGYTNDCWLRRQKASGQVLWQKNWTTDLAPTWGKPALLLALPDGGVAMAGARPIAQLWYTSYERAPFVVRLDIAGQTLWNLDFAESFWSAPPAEWGMPWGSYPKGLVGTPEGGFLLSQWGGQPAGSSAWCLTRLDAAGQVLALEPQFEGLLLPYPGGGYASAGSGKNCSFLRRLDATAGQVWSTVVSPCVVDGGGGETLAVMPDGDLVVTAGATPEYPDFPFVGMPHSLSRWTPTGQLRWLRSLEARRASAIAPISGGIVLAGVRPETKVAFLARTDAWGNTACTLPIPCASTATTACDDGNSCTADLCGPAGCTHVGVCATEP